MLLFLLAVVLATPGSVWATEAANLKIPPNQWGCQLCHGGATVTPTTVPPGEQGFLPLTEIGMAWLSQSADEANRLWSDLAAGNVDGDGCSTGFELGDPSGSWLPGMPPGPEQGVHDPNNHDCALPISAESWSRLKALFDEN